MIQVGRGLVKFGIVFAYVVLISIACQNKVILPSAAQVMNTNSGAVNSSSPTVEAKVKIEPPRSNELVPRGIDVTVAPSRIAFGSCAHQDQPQPIWDTILDNKPELFIFAGDNVYASKPENKPIGEQYKKLNNNLKFRNFREKIPIMATWDDHDYGLNDGGEKNPEKEEAKKQFLIQWPYVRDALKLGQGGVYHSKILGGAKKKSATVQLILLDTRWFRSELEKVVDSNQPLKIYKPTTDKKKTLLGETQWRWLAKELRKPADFKIIVSSIQFLADSHGFEKWGNFPHEKQRMIDLIKSSGSRNIVILSGDRHRGAIAKLDIKGWGSLYDITSSGINRTNDNDETDPLYVGEQIKKENFGWISVDWSRKIARVELRDMQNKTVNSVEIKLRK